MSIMSRSVRSALLQGAGWSIAAAGGLSTAAVAQNATPQQPATSVATTPPAATQDSTTTQPSPQPQNTPDTGANANGAQTTATQDAGASADAGQDSPDIVVTGSVFRRTNTETPSPVTTLTSETLARAGINNVSDAVRSISADSSGSIPTAFSNGFGAGSSAVSLRGLTVNSTLTLVDGVRTAAYPLADDGQRSFVDLNTIPQATIDRVEVLKDGASSTYGADAIAGVVNIITKKEITGLAGTVEAGVTDRGDGGSQRATLTVGHGVLKEDGYNIYVSGEYQRDSAIFNRSRGFPYNTDDLSSIGGDNNNQGARVPGATIAAVVAPTTQLVPGDILSGSGFVTGPFRPLNPAGCPAGLTPVTGAAGSGCEQNIRRDYSQLQPRQTRYGGTVHGTWQINDATQAYAAISYFQNEVAASGTPGSIRAINPINTLNVVLPALLRNGQLNPNNPFAATGQAAAIYYRFGDIPQSSEYRNRVLRAQTGISGSFGDGWGYSVDATAAKSWLRVTQDGYINLPALRNAVLDGTYNFVNPSLNSAALRAALAPTIVTDATSDLDQVQAVVTKDLIALPGGDLQLAVGGSFRYEAVNDPNQNPTNAALGLNQFSAIGDRKVYSAYFEVNAPFFDKLEVNGSGRYDHYSDGFSNFSPKIGAKFTPFRELALRGTFSKGFRAPSFAERGGNVTGFTQTRAPCSIQLQHGATGTAASCSGGSAYNLNYGFGNQTLGNPDLDPEKSTSFTAGTVVQPVRWFSFTVDYYNIKKTNIISAAPLTNDAIAAFYAGTALPAGYSVIPDAPDPAFPNAPRRALFVVGPFANAAALKTQGIDFAAQVNVKPAADVRFTSRAEATWILNYKFKAADGQPYDDYVGTQAPYITSSGAGTPEWRGNWQNSLEWGAYTLTATAYYTDGYKAVAADQYGGTDCETSSTYQGGDPFFNCRVKHFINVDLVGSMKVNDQFDLYFNVVNLLDEKAPLNAGNYAGVNYNPTYTQIGVVGRTIRVGANFKF